MEELWKRGQMEKLMQGQRTDQLPFPMPNPQGGPQQVPMQLKLSRDATGAVGVEVYLPAAVRERMEQAAAQQKAQPSQQQQPPAQEPPTPKVEAPTPPRRRRGPKL